LALLATAYILGNSPAANLACNRKAISCGFTENVGVIAIFALAGYASVVGRKRLMAVRHFVRCLYSSPGLLFDTPPADQLTPSISHDQLIHEIGSELSERVASIPIFLYGESGSGKTTLLAELARTLTQSHIIPVPVSVAGQQEMNLITDAEHVFRQAINRYLRSDDEGDTIWRFIRRARRVVIVVDGFDEFGSSMSAPSRERELRRACDTACREGLDVVVAVRSWIVDPGGNASIFKIQPFSEDEAAAYLRLRAKREIDAGLVVGKLRPILRTPFMLNLLADIPGLEVMPLDRMCTPLQAQVAVIAGYVRQLGIFDDSAQSPDARNRQAWKGLSLFAAALYLSGEPAATVKEATDLLELHLKADWELTRTVADAVRQGLAQELLEQPSGNQRVQFSHGLLADFFSSRQLRQQPTWFQRYRSAARLPHHFRAITMSGFDDAGMPDIAFIAEHEAELEKAALEAPRDPAAIAYGRSLINWRAASGDPDLSESLLTALVAARDKATRFDKQGIIEALGLQRGATGYRVLWEFALDRDFTVRWVAALTIAQGGNDAMEALGEEFTKAVRECEEAVATRTAVKRDLPPGVVAWVLPAITENSTGDFRMAASTLLLRVIALAEGPIDPLLMEQSLARGFKVAATLNNAIPVDPHSVTFIRNHPRFWYARVNTLHAIAIRSAGRPAATPERELIKTMASSDPHPFVKEAARIVHDALAREAGIHTVTWLSESEVLGREHLSLTDEAVALVADVTLLLNLVFCAASDSIWKRQTMPEVALWVSSPSIPLCLGASPGREELFNGGCPASCGFKLCPYPKKSNRNTARGDFNQAFCRHERRVVRSAGVRPWQNTSKRRLLEFWHRMEQVAADAGMESDL
jgi:molybdopterin-guanine dinucleotide biosynthesis protein